MKPLYIFDLDGTLALIEHRRHMVEGENKDWRGFFAACIDDEPYLAVTETLIILQESGADIWIWSGRSDEVEAETRLWLQAYGCLYSELRMRASGDHQPDEKLKAGWLASVSDNDRARIVAVFEDRDRMVKLWRDNGLACFQVAPGAF
jgi:hypothetical protein